MEKSLKQYEVLQWASSFLIANEREERIAEILLQHHLGMSRAAFYANMQQIISTDVLAVFKEDVINHIETGVPVQHLMGTASFYGREFKVNQHVLIPRFETEELVEAVFHSIRQKVKNEELIVADVGTGSGVIAITLKLLLPSLRIIATDISKEALQVAKRNAANYNVDVEFLEGDFLLPLLERKLVPNVIVSNPPYIKYSDREMLKDTVKDYDPELALFAKDEGLYAYKTIVSQAKAYRQSLKKLFFEIGYDQAEEVTNILHAAFPEAALSVLQDINKKNRIVRMDAE